MSQTRATRATTAAIFISISATCLEDQHAIACSVLVICRYDPFAPSGLLQVVFSSFMLYVRCKTLFVIVSRPSSLSLLGCSDTWRCFRGHILNMVFAYIAVFLLSIAANWMLILQARQPHLTRRQEADYTAVQSCHTEATPRVGGVALGLGLFASLFLMPGGLRADYSLFILSVIPVFAAGLCEDLGFRVSPKWRLIAGGIASLLAMLLLETWVTRVDLPGFDLLFMFAPVAIGFTIFATAGLSHAFNLIDGLNGLSTGAACAAALGLIAIAEVSGNAQFIPGKFMLIAALMGFLVFNFPWGRIFLGDAGAYAVGHLLGWFAILLVASDDRIAAWSIMLILFWPLADTFLAIYRRKQNAKALGQPDQMHMHHLMLRSLEIATLGRVPRRLANPLSVLMMMPMIFMPVGLGVVLWDRPLGAFVAFVGTSMLFSVTYFGLLRLAKRRFRGTPTQGDDRYQASDDFETAAGRVPQELRHTACDDTGKTSLTKV